MVTEKKDLLDSTVEKTNMFEKIMVYAHNRNENPLDAFNRLFNEWDNETLMLFVYLCKHYVKSEKDLWFIVNNLNIVQSLSLKEKKIVFNAFKVDDVVEMLNSIASDNNLFRVYAKNVFHVKYDILLESFLASFDKSTRDLFAKETGADVFVDFLAKFEEKTKAEAVARQVRRAKEEEEYRKKREEEEKEKKAAHEQRVKQADKRLNTIADILNKGKVIYFGKMPRKGIEVKEDIKFATIDAWRALYSALVNAQYNIKSKDQLEMFEDLLSYIDKKHHRFLKKDSVVKMAEEALGIKEDELDPTKYGKDKQSIARYKQVFEILATYPNIFASIEFPKFLRGINVFAYDNEAQRKRKVFSLKFGTGLLHNLIWRDTKIRKHVEEKISDKKYPAR